jgi:dTMP kinase
MRRRGYFITFEGPEGSGKSTVIRETAAYLKRRGFSILVLREPGGVPISEKIRKILLDRSNEGMTATAELFLYLAARAELVRQKIAPALKRGTIVICDRFHDSTVAYQGFGGGIPVAIIQGMGKWAKGGIEPDLTILLDVNTRTGLKRSGRRDRLEKKSIAYHRRVRRGFLSLAKKFPGRIVTVRDEKRVDRKVEKVKEVLAKFIARRT